MFCLCCFVLLCVALFCSVLFCCRVVFVLLFKRSAHSASPIGEDWRFAGMVDWGKGKFGLENGCFGAGKLVSGRPKLVLGLPNWRQNGSRAAKIGAWRVPGPPKLDLGRSGRRFGGLGARLDGHLGGPRDGLDVILGPLGRSGRRFGANFGGFDGPKRVRKGDFLDPKWKSAK